jgi:predicted nucleic acid-binding protein
MMHLFLDTNIVLDRLLRRMPRFAEQADFWRAMRAGRIIGYVSAAAVTDVFYIARRQSGLNGASAAVRDCLEAFTVCAVDGEMLKEALSLPGIDFEDNLQLVCARVKGLDAIVTRDRSGFRGSRIPVLSPAQAVAQLDA